MLRLIARKKKCYIRTVRYLVCSDILNEALHFAKPLSTHITTIAESDEDWVKEQRNEDIDIEYFRKVEELDEMINS